MTDWASHFNPNAVPSTPSWFPTSTAGLSKSALYTLYNTNIAHQLFGYSNAPDPANANALRALVAGSGGQPLTVAQINAAFGEPAANGAQTSVAHSQAVPTLSQRSSGLSNDSTAPGTSASFNPTTNPSAASGGMFAGAAGAGIGTMTGGGIGWGKVAIVGGVLLIAVLVFTSGSGKRR